MEQMNSQGIYRRYKNIWGPMVSTWTMKHKVACRGFSSPRKYGEKLQLPKKQNTRLLHSSLSCRRVHRSLYLDRASYKRSIKEPVGFKNKRQTSDTVTVFICNLPFGCSRKKEKDTHVEAYAECLRTGVRFPRTPLSLAIVLRYIECESSMCHQEGGGTRCL